MYYEKKEELKVKKNKNNRGRPSRKEESATKIISIRLTKEEEMFMDKIIEKCNGELSRSAFIRNAITYYSNTILEKNKKN